MPQKNRVSELYVLCKATSTMIDASATHRVLRIGELTRAITSHLILVGQKNTVNLACACQCLEEPVLSTLWEEQSRLETLLKVLPGDTWNRINPRFGEWVVRGLDLPSRMSNAQVIVALVQDREGSVTRDLEKSPALCVLDAQS